MREGLSPPPSAKPRSRSGGTIDGTTDRVESGGGNNAPNGDSDGFGVVDPFGSTVRDIGDSDGVGTKSASTGDGIGGGEGATATDGCRFVIFATARADAEAVVADGVRAATGAADADALVAEAAVEALHHFYSLRHQAAC